MTRALLTQVVFFFVPFVVFFVYLLLRRRNPIAFEHWERSIPTLAIAGLLCVVAALLYTGVVAPRSTGTYVPPHMEDGRIAPGRFE